MTYLEGIIAVGPPMGFKGGHWHTSPPDEGMEFLSKTNEPKKNRSVIKKSERKENQERNCLGIKVSNLCSRRYLCKAKLFRRSSHLTQESSEGA
jgi:hypothetical protein